MPATGAIGRRDGFIEVVRTDAVLAELYRTGSVELLIIRYGKAPKGMRKWSGVKKGVNDGFIGANSCESPEGSLLHLQGLRNCRQLCGRC